MSRSVLNSLAKTAARASFYSYIHSYNNEREESKACSNLFYTIRCYVGTLSDTEQKSFWYLWYIFELAELAYYNKYVNKEEESISCTN